MSPSRIQSAAGNHNPAVSLSFFSHGFKFPFSPRSALLRPGPRRQGIGFASLRALDRCGPGREAGSTTREKGGVWRVSPRWRSPRPIIGVWLFMEPPAFAGSGSRPRHPTRQTGASPLPLASVTRECLNWPFAPRNRTALYSLLTLARWFPLIRR